MPLEHMVRSERSWEGVDGGMVCLAAYSGPNGRPGVALRTAGVILGIAEMTSSTDTGDNNAVGWKRIGEVVHREGEEEFGS